MPTDSSLIPSEVASVASGFTALWRAGEFSAAGEKYWADDVVRIEPRAPTGDTDAACQGIDAVRARNLHWFATHGVEDLSVDGPFVTGDHFALFADMLVVHAGQRTPHSQIAVFVVRGGKIVEERYFHE